MSFSIGGDDDDVAPVVSKGSLTLNLASSSSSASTTSGSAAATTAAAATASTSTASTNTTTASTGSGFRENPVLSDEDVDQSLRHLLKATLSSLASEKMSRQEAADSVRAVLAGLMAGTQSIPSHLRADTWMVLLQVDLQQRTTLLCDANDRGTTPTTTTAGETTSNWPLEMKSSW
jgi:hypothetical protein